LTYSRILGTGSYLPARILTNADLEKLIDTNDQWIVDRTGIRERHIAAEGEFTSDLAVQAARAALEALGLGFFWIGIDRRKQGFHDKLANTVVVYDDD